MNDDHNNNDDDDGAVIYYCNDSLYLVTRTEPAKIGIKRTM